MPGVVTWLISEPSSFKTGFNVRAPMSRSFQSGAFPRSKDAGRRSVFTRSRGENIIVSRLAISTPLPKIAAWGILSVKSLMTGSIGNLRLKQSKINDEARGIRRWGPAQAREGR